MPSLDCFVRRRMLVYLLRLIRDRFGALHACLQSKSKHGGHKPWIELITSDLAIFCETVPEKLGDMPSPHDDLQAWWRLARDYPASWKQLDKLYFSSEEDDANSATRLPSGNGVSSVPCFECTQSWGRFCDQRRSAVHVWSKHGVKSDAGAWRHLRLSP